MFSFLSNNFFFFFKVLMINYCPSTACPCKLWMVAPTPNRPLCRPLGDEGEAWDMNVHLKPSPPLFFSTNNIYRLFWRQQCLATIMGFVLFGFIFYLFIQWWCHTTTQSVAKKKASDITHHCTHHCSPITTLNLYISNVIIVKWHFTIESKHFEGM